MHGVGREGEKAGGRDADVGGREGRGQERGEVRGREGKRRREEGDRGKEIRVKVRV